MPTYSVLWPAVLWRTGPKASRRPGAALGASPWQPLRPLADNQLGASGFSFLAPALPVLTKLASLNLSRMRPATPRCARHGAAACGG
jgi:hypothetical protein